ncbi:MAG: helix-turn-helix domain-containing protein [Pseudomonadota bacterium]
MAKAIDPARYRAHGLLRRLARMAGMDVPQFLAAAGLPRGLAAHPRPTLTAAQVTAAWEAAEGLLGDGLTPETLRLDLRTRFNPAVFALASAPDVGAGLHRWARLAPLARPGGGGLETRATLRFSGRPLLGAVELVQVLDALRMASARRLVPEAISLPPGLPQRAEILAHAGLRAAEDGAPALHFATADLAHPLVAPLQETWEDLDLGQPLYEPGTARDLRFALPGLLAAGRPSAEAAAARLRLSKRTLQRRLLEVGAPFQEVLARERQRLAALYLAHPGLRIEEVSLLLGFHGPGSFYRAHLGWTGKTPRNLRDAMSK